MTGLVIPIRPRQNVVMVQPSKSGFDVTLIKPNGWRKHLGTREHLGEAESFARNEAFKVGRCRTQILGQENCA